MSNPNRKMVTIRKVDGVTPIKDADRIECLHFGGWQVVAKKGEFKEGDYTLYYEVDSALPISDPNYAFLADGGTKVMEIDGSDVEVAVLRTRKLRGVFSQGLVLPVETFIDTTPENVAMLCERRIDVSRQCGVVEYHKPTPGMKGEFIGRYDPYIAPRTNAERVQNVTQCVFDLIKRTEYFTSIKVDGTSISMLWDDRTNSFRVFSHNNEFDTSVGIGKIAYERAERQGLIGWCRENHMVTLQAELCGPKIQSDRLGLWSHRLFVFSAWDVIGGHYLTPEQAGDILRHEQAVPIVSLDLSSFATQSDLIEYTDGLRGNVTKNRLDEGVVIHITGIGDLNSEEMGDVLNALGPTMQMKSINRAYLAKAKE